MMIGICGGIGSGKSVVSRVLRLRGEAVYDCDLEGRRIMDGSEEVLSALHERYGEEVCPPGGPIRRPELARRVFGSDDERIWLNRLVHKLVREDVERWKDRMLAAGKARCFVESAILASSGLVAMCGEVWLVTAPDEVRIARTMARDGLDAEQIRQRIRSQMEEVRLLKESGVPMREIDNGNSSALLEELA